MLRWWLNRNLTVSHYQMHCDCKDCNEQNLGHLKASLRSRKSYHTPLLMISQTTRMLRKSFSIMKSKQVHQVWISDQNGFFWMENCMTHTSGVLQKHYYIESCVYQISAGLQNLSNFNTAIQIYLCLHELNSSTFHSYFKFRLTVTQ